MFPGAESRGREVLPIRLTAPIGSTTTQEAFFDDHCALDLF
jgi:hypothetical protein